MPLILIFVLPFVSAVPWLEQISRQDILAAGCQRLNKTQELSSTDLNHILIDHKHRFLYCYVPKVGCTNWKRVLLVLNGQFNATEVLNIPSDLVHGRGVLPRLSQESDENVKYMLANYTSFMMVRHPFERLLSAYRNKLEGQKSSRYFQEKFGKKIIKTYRNNPNQQDVRTGSNVTFKEFVKFLINEPEMETFNEHWKSIMSLCLPCSVDYNFIGKYESFSEDTAIVLNMIGAPNLDFPHTTSGGTSEKVRWYYQQLQMEEIEQLYKLYEEDFKLFGYTSENVLGFDIG